MKRGQTQEKLRMPGGKGSRHWTMVKWQRSSQHKKPTKRQANVQHVHETQNTTAIRKRRTGLEKGIEAVRYGVKKSLSLQTLASALVADAGLCPWRVPLLQRSESVVEPASEQSSLYSALVSPLSPLESPTSVPGEERQEREEASATWPLQRPFETPSHHHSTETSERRASWRPVYWLRMAKGGI